MITGQYTRLWRNKFLTIDAKSIGEMAEILTAAAAELSEMSATGKIVIDPNNPGCVSDDYAFLVTDDSELAAKYGFEVQEDGEDEDDFDDSSDEVEVEAST